MRPDERLGPADYAELLEAVRGLPTRRRRDGGYWGHCPFPERHVHGDRTPSLAISEGRETELALECFGCHATFEELLAAVGVERSKSSQVVVKEQIEYLRICSGSCLNELLGDVSRTPTIGIDPMDCRAAVEEVDFLPVYVGEADLYVKMPKRAGRVMRHVLEDLVELANERLASGWKTTPLAYGCDDRARALGVNRSAITQALHALERHGVIERVRRLPLLKIEKAGAWTWRLVVVPATEPGDEMVPEADLARTSGDCLVDGGITSSSQPRGLISDF